METLKTLVPVVPKDVSNAVDIALTVDSDLNLIDCTPGFAKLVESDITVVKLNSLSDFICDNHLDDVAKRIRLAIKDGTGSRVTFEFEVLTTNYKSVWVAGRLAEQPETKTALLCLQDISRIRSLNERLSVQASRDDLTGLYARSHFARLIEHNLSRGIPSALVVLDIKNFSALNYKLGTEKSDEVLCEVASRLKTSLSKEYFLSRLDTDRFGIYITRCADLSIEKLVFAVKAIISTPIEINTGQTISLSCHCGYTVFPEDASSFSQGHLHALQACEKAKSLGEFIVRFDKSLILEEYRRASLTFDVDQGLRNGEFQIHFQPIVSYAGDIVGVESLMRWKHKGQWISPFDFISAAEQNVEAIKVLGDWAIRYTCSKLKQWNLVRKHKGKTPLFGSVNVSPQQLKGRGFERVIDEALELTGVPAQWLRLELTESTFVEGSDALASVLQAVSNKGIKVAVDDFGTGYSSLINLKRFPVSEIKVDRSFVRNLTENQVDQAVVKSVTFLAKQLQIDVVIEGVETQEQRNFFKDNQFVLFQGWLFDKALTEQELEKKYLV